MKNLYVLDNKENITNEIKSNYFILVKNTGWNDYMYRTAFNLYIDVNDSLTLFGEVKILKKGQIDDNNFYLENGPLDNLNDDFCSIGQSLDYYERISDLVDDEKTNLLNKLNDIIFIYDEASYFDNEFSNENGYSKSLFRFIGKQDDILIMSKAILEKRYDSIPKDGLKFSFKANNWDKEIIFDFEEYDILGWYTNKKALLPSSIACIIGSNGTGKSTFLSRLARVAYAPKKDRLANDFGGILEPSGLGFPRIISISYSAFDNFKIPGIDIDEKKQIIKDMQSEKGRYFYCGLRDIINEELEDLDEDKVVESKLKSMQSLSNEFKNKLQLIKTKNRQQLLKESLGLLSKEHTFEKIKSLFDNTHLAEHEIEAIGNNFLEWSTGHKIIMHIIVNIIAHTEQKSLILLDEPETHLHPPLLSAFMHTLRHILNKNKSYCITATHSPVVLQETLSKDVHILTQYGGTVAVSDPEIQTFAEAIGEITSDVFGLNSSITDFHSILRIIADNCQTYEEAIKLFDENISTQGRAYLISYFAKKNEK